MLDLSIIILSCNNKKVLDECIYSVYTYTQGVSFEVIVTDNGSTDGTQAMLKQKFENVILLDNRANLGFTVANNKGLRIAKGRYSVLLNDDTYLTEDSLSQIVRFMDSDPKIGVCGPRLLNPDGSIQSQGSILQRHVWKTRSPRNVPMVIGACFFIRTSMIEEIGMLDENLFFYNDDIDYCLRARKAGYKVVYYPLSSVYHYGGFSSKGKPNRKLVVEGYRGGLYFCKKYYGALAYHVYRLLLLIYMLIALLYSWITSYWNKEWYDIYSDIIQIIISQQILSK